MLSGMCCYFSDAVPDCLYQLSDAFGIPAINTAILLTSGEVDLSVGALMSFVTVIVMDVINISGSIFLGFFAVFTF